jgi:tetratricopeptide (TPR) repeat protein
VKKAVKAGERAALLLEAGVRSCYRPECRRPLIVQIGDERVADFEVAHIRDELPPASPTSDLGWRYWPDDLSQDERNRFANLMLLCPTCHKLIDKVNPRQYAVELLTDWKRQAEDGVFHDLGADVEAIDIVQLSTAISRALTAAPGLNLELPTLATADGLSFASRITEFLGRTEEVAAVRDFLNSAESFAWWSVVGDAGAGKSRFALEVCSALDTRWNSGFIRDEQEQDLLGFVPEKPTLLVVDYASSRADWLGRCLLDFTTRAGANWPALRVLVLERDSGTESRWFRSATRQQVQHESVSILSKHHAESLQLAGLHREELREIVHAASGGGVSRATVEDLVDRALTLDPEGRPLFALIAALEHSEPTVSGRSRDAVIRSLVLRRNTQADSEDSVSARFVSMAATALGGVRLHDLGQVSGSAEHAHFDIAPIQQLPLDVLDSLMSGMTPDILGEMWVLDELAASGTRRDIAVAALAAAWQFSSSRYSSFVDRCARDHPTHSQLPALLDVDLATDCQRWFEMATSMIPHLRNPTSPSVDEVVTRIARLDASILRDAAAMEAKFKVANLWLDEGRADTAHAIYTEIIGAAPQGSPIVWQCLTNRGVVAMQRDDIVAAENDWGTVIDASEAPDEARACCLNNRADIRAHEDNHEAAIADRSSVLALEDTTYNRRYIALVRRARSLWELGRRVDADGDIDTILETEDIAIEQKMAARLMRAEWAIDLGVEEVVSHELQIVRDSRRNFNSIADRADALWEALTPKGD